METLNYQTHLQNIINSGASKRKGDRTRDRLIWATAVALNDVGSHDMKLTDICELAGVSPAAFYLYFENKTEITRRVLTDFVAAILELVVEEPQSDTVFGTIVHAMSRAVELFSANAGLMRCVFQLCDQAPEFRKLWQETWNQWYRRISDLTIQRFGRGNVDDTVVLLACHMVAGMVEELLRDLYINKNPQLVEAVGEVAQTPSALAEYVSVVWYRALYAENPDPKQITHARPLLNMKLEK